MLTEPLLVIDSYELALFARSQSTTAPNPLGIASSARNRFVGLVTDIRVDEVMAQVELQCGPFRVVSLMSRVLRRPLWRRIEQVTQCTRRSSWSSAALGSISWLDPSSTPVSSGGLTGFIRPSSGTVGWRTASAIS